MGEPRTPTPQDRAATRHLAARILHSIRADEEMAIGLDEMEFVSGRYGYYSEAVEDLVASLAQEVCALGDVESRTVSILSAAKVPPCDDDGNGWEVDQRVRWLVQRVAELEANAVRMREYRFALDGISTDGKGNPIEETR